MANSYSVVPSVIPGTLTIGGDLDVKGEIRVGPFTPRMHLYMLAASNLFLTFNLQKDGTTRDQAGTDTYALLLGSGASMPGLYIQKGGGTAMQMANVEQLFSDYTQHIHTGTTTQDTIYSKVIRANQLGANAGIRIVVLYTPSVQGATPSSLVVALGGTSLRTVSIAAARAGQPCLLEIILGANNSQASELVYDTDQVSGSAPILTYNPQGVNLAADQTLTLKITNGAASDSQHFDVCAVDLLNTFGPVA